MITKIFYNLYKIIIGPIFYILYRPKIRNKNLIPRKGRVILAGNHIHLYDQFLPALSTNRYISFLAKKEYFDKLSTKWFFKSVGCISVDRKNKGGNAINEGIKVLNKNGVIGLFPEGTRNKTNKILLPFKKGVGILSKETNSVIIPFVIKGKYKIINNNLEVIFLKPIYPKNLSIDEITNKLENSIKEELNKERR